MHCHVWTTAVHIALVFIIIMLLLYLWQYFYVCVLVARRRDRDRDDDDYDRRRRRRDDDDDDRHGNIVVVWLSILTVRYCSYTQLIIWQWTASMLVICNCQAILKLTLANPVCVPGLRIDPLRLLAGCRKMQLNQAPLNLRGLCCSLMMNWSERENIRKRGPLWEPFSKNSALCSWQANQSWFKERINPQAPNGSAWGNRKKHHITVRDLLRFLTSSWRVS